MNLRFVSLVTALALSSCTEDFDQYTFGGAGASGAGASGAGASGAGGTASGGSASGGSASGGSASGGSASGGAPQGGGPTTGGAPQGGNGGSGGMGETFDLPCGSAGPCVGPDEKCCDKSSNGAVACVDANGGCPSGSAHIEIFCGVAADCADGGVCCADIADNAGTVTCAPTCEAPKLEMCAAGGPCSAPATCKQVEDMPTGYLACQ